MAWNNDLVPNALAIPKGSAISRRVWYTRSGLLGSGIALQILLVIVWAKNMLDGLLTEQCFHKRQYWLLSWVPGWVAFLFQVGMFMWSRYKCAWAGFVEQVRCSDWPPCELLLFKVGPALAMYQLSVLPQTCLIVVYPLSQYDAATISSQQLIVIFKIFLFLCHHLLFAVSVVSLAA